MHPGSVARRGTNGEAAGTSRTAWLEKRSKIEVPLEKV
jgi:hypothetical protein